MRLKKYWKRKLYQSTNDYMKMNNWQNVSIQKIFIFIFSQFSILYKLFFCTNLENYENTYLNNIYSCRIINKIQYTYIKKIINILSLTTGTFLKQANYIRDAIRLSPNNIRDPIHLTPYLCVLTYIIYVIRLLSNKLF